MEVDKKWLPESVNAINRLQYNMLIMLMCRTIRGLWVVLLAKFDIQIFT